MLRSKGDGLQSVFVLQRERLEIVREERLAIRWCMGTRCDASETRFI